MEESYILYPHKWEKIKLIMMKLKNFAGCKMRDKYVP